MLYTNNKPAPDDENVAVWEDDWRPTAEQVYDLLDPDRIRTDDEADEIAEAFAWLAEIGELETEPVG